MLRYGINELGQCPNCKQQITVNEMKQIEKNHKKEDIIPMKKILAVILISLLCCSCTNQGNQLETETTQSIEYVEGNFTYDIENDEFMRNFSFMETCVPDKEAAAEIATAIFNSVNKDDSQYDNHEIFLIEYDTDDEIWLVYFGEPGAAGGGFHIALRKDNAEVVRMWVDE